MILQWKDKILMSSDKTSTSKCLCMPYKRLKGANGMELKRILCQKAFCPLYFLENLILWQNLERNIEK